MAKSMVKGLKSGKDTKTKDSSNNGKRNVYAGTGISKNDDPFLAGKEAVEMAIKNMAKQGCLKGPDFAFVFCSGSKYGKDDKTMKKLADGADGTIKSMNPSCKWVGCTTAGEISNHGFTTHSCVAMAIQSDFMHFGIGIAGDTNKNPKEAGARSIQNALKSLNVDKYVEPYVRYIAEKQLPVSELVKMRPYTIVMLNTGFTATKRGNEDDIVEGIVQVVGPRIPILGASSGDDFTLKATYVFTDGQIYKEAVISTIISSSIKISGNVSHGYFPSEKSMFVNSAEDYLIKELDGKPAFDRYSEIVGKPKGQIWPKSMRLQKMGPISSAFMSFATKMGVDIMKLSPIIGINCNTPLALVEYKPYVKGRFWIKTIDSVIDDKYLQFTEKVPQGCALYLMETNPQKSLNAGADSIEKSLSEIDNDASFALVFDCALHRWFLSQHAAKSVELVRKRLHDVPFIGFHAYGEILDGKHTLSVVSVVASSRLVANNEVKPAGN